VVEVDPVGATVWEIVQGQSVMVKVSPAKLVSWNQSRPFTGELTGCGSVCLGSLGEGGRQGAGEVSADVTRTWGKSAIPISGVDIGGNSGPDN
jgi:hypothetical protein